MASRSRISPTTCFNACDADTQISAAKQQFGTENPTGEEIAQATEQLARHAVTPFLKAAFRRRILEIHQQNEQTIDRHTADDVLYSGFDALGGGKSADQSEGFSGLDRGTQRRVDRTSSALCWFAAT